MPLMKILSDKFYLENKKNVHTEMFRSHRNSNITQQIIISNDLCM